MWNYTPMGIVKLVLDQILNVQDVQPALRYDWGKR